MIRRWKNAFVAAACLSVAVAACRPAGDGSGDDDDDDDAASTGTPTPTATPIELESTPYSVAAGAEIIQCYYTSLPSSSPVDIGAISSSLTPGVAGIFVHRTDTVTEPDGTLTECNADSLGAPIFVYASSQASESVTFPADSGISMIAGQPIVMRLHYVNAGSDPIDAHATLSLQPVADASQKVGTLYTYNASIDIPPGSTNHEETAVCEPPSGAQIFWMTTDSRKLTVAARVYRHAGSTGELLLETLDWEAPSVGLYTPPLTFDSGEGLQYTCTYTNPGGTTVSSGSSSSDEVCSAIGYYVGATVNAVCIDSFEITSPL